MLQLRPARARHAANQLTCFGGRREEGEEASACLERELHEELGWKPHSAQPCCELWKSTRLVARFYRVQPQVEARELTVEADFVLIATPWSCLPGLPISPWHRLVLAGMARGLSRVSVENAG